MGYVALPHPKIQYHRKTGTRILPNGSVLADATPSDTPFKTSTVPFKQSNVAPINTLNLQPRLEDDEKQQRNLGAGAALSLTVTC